MTGDGGPDAPAFVHSLRMDDVEGAPEISIVTTERPGGDDVRTSVAWRHRFGSAAAARICMGWMSERQCRWSRWAAAAILLGRPFVAGVIEGEMMAEERTGAQAPRRHGSIRARDAGVVVGAFDRVRLVLTTTRPRLVFERRGRAFAVLKLPSEEQALRMWDWLRWQGWLLGDLHALERRGGTELLTGVIVDLMVAEERRAGSASGGAEGRPLRDWRP